MVESININFFFRHRFALRSAFRSRFLLTLGSAFSFSELKFFSSNGEAELAYYSRLLTFFLFLAWPSYLAFPVWASYSSSSKSFKRSWMSTLR